MCVCFSGSRCIWAHEDGVHLKHDHLISYGMNVAGAARDDDSATGGGVNHHMIDSHSERDSEAVPMYDTPVEELLVE